MPWLAAVLRSTAIVLFLAYEWPAHAAAPVFEPPVPLLASEVDGTPPVAVTNGSGTWVVAWSTADLLGGANGGDRDVLFARSTDGGLTFGAPAALNTNAAHDTKYVFDTLVIGDHDDSPALAAHGNRMIAVWHFSDSWVNTLRLARSDDAGATWTDPVVLFDHAFNPTIANDGAGTWVIVWQRKTGVLADGDLYVTRSTDDGLTWSAGTALNSNAVSDNLTDAPGPLVYAAGVWVVPWTAHQVTAIDPSESHVMFARSVDGGVSWSPVAPLNTGPGAGAASDLGPSLTRDASGAWIAAWTNHDGGDRDILTARSSDGAVTWTAPVPLNADFASDEWDDYPPSIASDGAGNSIVEWSRFGLADQPNANHVDVVVASTSDGGASWSAPTLLNPLVATNTVPYVMELAGRIAVDPAGYFVALWSSNTRTLASGTRTRGKHEVVYALAGHPCGDAALDPGETCDDGDRGALDCCGRTCAFDPPEVACAADGDLCTLERCDGAGTCGHVNAPAGTPCTKDADLCTHDRCDGNAVCEHVYEPQPTTMEPLKPKSSTLSLAGGEPEKRKLTWTWTHGPEATPSGWSIFATGSDYALCLYDGSGLAGRFDIPAGGTCGYLAGSCWKFQSKFGGGSSKLQYLKRDGASDGVTAATFKTGSAGKTQVKIVGRGANMPAPALPMSGPVHAQLITEDLGRTVSVAATYVSGVKTNGPDAFKAKSE